MLAILSNIPLHKIRTGDITASDEWKLVIAGVLLKASPLFIDDTAVLTPEEIKLRLQRFKRTHDIKIAFIDYLQLLHLRRRVDSRQQEMAEISRYMKLTAKDVGVAIIALSQLSRAVEQRQNKRPQLSDLRESGAIEQDADIVMFLYRHEYYARSEYLDQLHGAELIIAKQRNGAVGTIFLAFYPQTTAFLEIENSA